MAKFLRTNYRLTGNLVHTEVIPTAAARPGEICLSASQLLVFDGTKYLVFSADASA